MKAEQLINLKDFLNKLTKNRLTESQLYIAQDKLLSEKVAFTDEWDGEIVIDLSKAIKNKPFVIEAIKYALK